MFMVEVTVIFDEVNFLCCLKPANGAAECWQLDTIEATCH